MTNWAKEASQFHFHYLDGEPQKELAGFYEDKLYEMSQIGLKGCICGKVMKYKDGTTFASKAYYLLNLDPFEESPYVDGANRRFALPVAILHKLRDEGVRFICIHDIKHFIQFWATTGVFFTNGEQAEIMGVKVITMSPANFSVVYIEGKSKAPRYLYGIPDLNVGMIKKALYNSRDTTDNAY